MNYRIFHQTCHYPGFSFLPYYFNQGLWWASNMWKISKQTLPALALSGNSCRARSASLTIINNPDSGSCMNTSSDSLASASHDNLCKIKQFSWMSQLKIIVFFREQSSRESLLGGFCDFSHLRTLNLDNTHHIIVYNLSFLNCNFRLKRRMSSILLNTGTPLTSRS